MPLPIAMITTLVSSLMSGPVSKILDAYIKDSELRRKLEADLQSRLVEHLNKEEGLQQSIVLAEIQSDSWITRAWRPVLMLSLLGFLVFVGLILPLADILAGKPLPFYPRWAALPPGFWDFLSIGVGGYIGGRSLEKIAGQLPASPPRRKA
ncbi:MAG: hypothetical protein GYA66_14905 [Phyllobacteriaceae bacterium]|jgi:hypothetical protein|nr:hypothetical protein [Phyllobacteriaceae bacterium]